MAQGLSNYADQQMLLSIFGNSTFAANLTVGLSTTTVNADGTGITEPTTGGYAAQSVANTTANWPVTVVTGGGYQTKNANQINFPTATANYNAPVTDWFIKAGTNLVSFGKITASDGVTPSAKTINNSDPVYFPANAIVIQNV